MGRRLAGSHASDDHPEGGPEDVVRHDVEDHTWGHGGGVGCAFLSGGRRSGPEQVLDL